MREALDLAGFFTLGLLGGFGHCVGMCAPFVIYVSRRFVPVESGRSTVLWQQSLYGAGRLTTYAAMGAAAGALGGAVDLAGEIFGFQRAAAVFAGGVLIVYGLVSLFNLLPLLSESGGPVFARVAGLLRNRSPNSAFVTGLLLGFLPCGLVYSAVIAAAARGGALEGALGLALFGLGTVPAMLGLSMVDALLARHRSLINRLSMVFILGMGAWFVWRGLVG